MTTRFDCLIFTGTTARGCLMSTFPFFLVVHSPVCRRTPGGQCWRSTISVLSVSDHWHQPISLYIGFFFSFPSFPSRFIPVCCWTASDVLFAPSICLPAGSLTCVFSYFSPCPMRRTSRKKEASILRKKKDKLRRKFQKLPTDIPCLTLSGAVRIFVLQRPLSSFFFFPPFRSLSRLFLSLAFSVGCGGATLGPGIGGWEGIEEKKIRGGARRGDSGERHPRPEIGKWKFRWMYSTSWKGATNSGP